MNNNNLMTKKKKSSSIPMPPDEEMAFSETFARLPPRSVAFKPRRPCAVRDLPFLRADGARWQPPRSSCFVRGHDSQEEEEEIAATLKDLDLPLSMTTEEAQSKRLSTLSLMKNTPPDEMVVSEIFTRLPPRSVLRLSSACKSWRSSTVRNLVFLRAHRARCQSPPRQSSCFFLKKCLSAQMTRIDVSHHNQEEIAIRKQDLVDYQEDLPPVAPLTLTASCDNLLCFFSVPLNCYYVHNLSTKDWMAVPMVCHPGDDFLSYLRALYYHPSSGEYRLMSCFKTADLDPTKERTNGFGVFSLKLGAKWRSIDCFPPHGEGPPSHCPVSARLTQGLGMYEPRATTHGNVHWAPEDNHPWILAFDVETEIFRWLDIPRPLRQSNALETGHCYVITLGQDLVLTHRKGNRKLDLWLLKDYYMCDEEDCWVKLHTISIPRIRNYVSSGSNRVMLLILQPVAICSGADNGEDLLLLRFNGRDFVLYNLISKKIKCVTSKESPGIFVGSLVGTLPCLLYSFN